MPIVKVLTRSSPGSYGSLVNYLMREGKGKDGGKPLLITHNMRGSTKDEFVQSFLENESWRKYTRKDAILLYHEIVSFGKGDVENMTTEMLIDLAEKYMDYRGRDGQYLAAIHEDRDNAHIHFAVSGVKYKTGMAHRLTRTDLALLKDNIQNFQRQKYSELVHSLPEHGKNKDYETNPEYYQRKRNERANVKAQLKEQVEMVYRQSKTQNQFLELLQSAGLAVYERNGLPVGLMHEDMKYRFGSMDIPFDELPIDRTEEEKVLDEIRAIREQREELDKKYEIERDDMDMSRYIHLNPNSLFE